MSLHTASLLRFVHQLRFFILAFFIFISLLFYRGDHVLQMTQYADMDAYARNNLAHQIAQRPRDWLYFVSQQSGHWLPVHPFLTGMSLAVFQYESTPTVVSWFAMSLAMVVIYALSREITKLRMSEEVSIVSSLFAAALFQLLPMTSFLAGQVLTEALSILILLAFWLALLRQKYLLLICLLMIGMATRYEFWMLLPFSCGYLCTGKELPRKKKVLFVLLLTVVPTTWMLRNIWQYGNPLYFLNFNTTANHKLSFLSPVSLSASASQRMEYGLTKWVRIFTEVYPLLLTVLSVGGVLATAKKLTKGEWFILGSCVVFFILLINQITVGVLFVYPYRYLYPVVYPLIPFTALALGLVLEHVKAWKSRGVILALCLLSISQLVGWSSFDILDKTTRSELQSIEKTLKEKGLTDDKYKMMYLTKTLDWNHPYISARTANYKLQAVDEANFSQAENFDYDVLISGVEMPHEEFISQEKYQKIYESASYVMYVRRVF